ncbi:MAG: histidine kinase [Afipia sp.]|nr:histidine kinase [Afipia sp.]
MNQASSPGFLRPRFSIIHQFMAVAGITIVLAMGLLAYVVSEKFKASLMQTAAEEGALLIEAFLEPSVQELVTSETLSATATKRLDELLLGKLGERIPVIKIWLRDGTLAYATNKKMVGEKFPSAHLDEAFRSKISGSFDDLDDPENTLERDLKKQLIEIYAPLYRTGTSNIIAVGEIYNDGERLAAELKSIQFAVAGIVGAVSAPMLLLLFFMVRHTDLTMTKHREALVQKIIETEALADQNGRLRRAAEDARLEGARSNESLLGQIGRDLHDGPIQLLGMLMLKLTGGSAAADSKPEKNHGDTGSSRELTRRALVDLRNIATGLVLPELHGLTTAETLWLAVRQHEATTGTLVACQIGDLPAHLSPSLKICLYRIVQEGLNNAFHHANGDGQSVQASADTNWISIVVRDAGPKNKIGNPSTRRSKTGLGIPGLICPL